VSELEGRRRASEAARLERRYGRLLACYPRAYRRENEEEILGVLLACAHDGRQWPGLAVAADLIKGALRMRMRLWPAARPPRTVQAAVGLVCAGVAAQLAALITEVVTAGSVGSAYARGYPPGAVAAVRHALAVSLAKVQVEVAIGIGVWLLLAWALVRGGNLARFACAAWFIGMDCLNMLPKITRHAVVSAPADMTAFAVVWLLALAASVLLFTGPASRYYRRGLPGSQADTGDYGDYSALLARLKEMKSRRRGESANPTAA
jgi:hypothetical protein